MIFPDNFETKIGFDKIKNMISQECLGESAKVIVENLFFSNNFEYLNNQLKETEEMISICMLKDNYPAQNYPDIDKSIKKLLVEGISLQLNEIINIRLNLEQAKSIYNFFKTDEKNDYSSLNQIINKINFPTFLHDRINSVISKNNSIKDTASPKLKEIRKILIETQNQITKKLNSILASFKENSWVSKELTATYVNGRLVLPIETAHKRKIKGLIHDESASGKTSYIEPQEIVDLNNSLRELEIAENREIQKILLELTIEFKPYYEDLLQIFETISYLDFVRAKAKFSIRIEAIIPKLDKNPGLDLHKAIHPLLFLSLKKEKKKVVPSSFYLNNENRILVISGPNAGGKSVCLKTTALLTYMCQCGLPIPVGGNTVIGIFNKIFLDIGDQQSIENDLSTYSSHLLNMKNFIKNSDENSLILIDEFGSGTDPIIGGILAESILEGLNKKNVFGIITTHYSNLKIFASNTPGIFNGAMLIDHNNMQPTFTLETGIPGSSYAIEIASRIGLPQNIIDKTKEKTGEKQINIDKFLRKVMRDKKYWESKRLKIRSQEKQLEEILKKNIEELEKLKTSRKQIIEAAKKESQQMLADVNKQIENTIRQIKESKADKEISKKAREEIQEFKNNFENSVSNENDEIEKKYNLYKKKQEEREAKRKDKKEKPEIIKIDENKINIGSKVKIKGQEIIGEVIEFNNKNAIVSYGNMFTSIALEKLEKVSENLYKQQNRSTPNLQFNYNQKLMNFRPYIDIRGDRVEEAIKKITELVDEAIMLRIKEIKILHGKGNGILRQHIRDYLKTITEIENFYNEDIRFGGDGITIVKIK